MNFFLATNYIEYNGQLSLVEIALVKENGQHYHRINKDCKFLLADEHTWETRLNPLGITKHPVAKKFPRWLHDLLPKFYAHAHHEGRNGLARYSRCESAPLRLIRRDIESFCYCEHAEFWGRGCSYDWMTFCRIWESSGNLPRYFARSCNEITVALQSKEAALDSLPTLKENCSPLEKAFWCQKTYKLSLVNKEGQDEAHRTLPRNTRRVSSHTQKRAQGDAWNTPGSYREG